MLLGDEQKISSRYLIQGYQQALQRAGLCIEDRYLIGNCFSYEHGSVAMKRLLSSNNPPTAVIFADHLCLSSSDIIDAEAKQALSPYHAVKGALAQCEQMKITIPDQLSLIYFSHNTLKQHNQLDTLSCVNKPVHVMANNAVNLLTDLIARQNVAMQTSFTPTTQAIDTQFIFRHST